MGSFQSLPADCIPKSINYLITFYLSAYESKHFSWQEVHQKQQIFGGCRLGYGQKSNFIYPRQFIVLTLWQGWAIISHEGPDLEKLLKLRAAR